jgi:hypothetical protein
VNRAPKLTKNTTQTREANPRVIRAGKKMKPYRRTLLAAIAIVAAIPAIAAEPLYGEFRLNAGFGQTSVNGFTGGAHSFTEQFKRDNEGNICVGYGDVTPDYIMVVESEFPQLSLRVNSGGKDTTLVIQDRDRGTIYCGDDDDSRNSKDAIVTQNNWPAGTYQIWVGSFEPHQRWNYNLIVREN